MSQINVADKKKNRALWPLLGFFMAVCLGVIGFFLERVLHQQVLDFLTKQKISTAGLPPTTVPIIFTVAFFILGLTLASLVVAIFAPKKTDVIKSTDLVKERKDLMAHKRDIRARQRAVSRSFKSENDEKK